eukprot:257635-Pleurochrysis_carterae.AAC.1
MEYQRGQQQLHDQMEQVRQQQKQELMMQQKSQLSEPSQETASEALSEQGKGQGHHRPSKRHSDANRSFRERPSRSSIKKESHALAKGGKGARRDAKPHAERSGVKEAEAGGQQESDAIELEDMIESMFTKDVYNRHPTVRRERMPFSSSVIVTAHAAAITPAQLLSYGAAMRSHLFVREGSIERLDNSAESKSGAADETVAEEEEDPPTPPEPEQIASSEINHCRLRRARSKSPLLSFIHTLTSSP